MLMSQNMTENIEPDESELSHEIKTLLSAESYIVKRMTEEDFNTRYVLYNRIRKWMVKNDLGSRMYEKVGTIWMHISYFRLFFAQLIKIPRIEKCNEMTKGGQY